MSTSSSTIRCGTSLPLKQSGGVRFSAGEGGALRSPVRSHVGHPASPPQPPHRRNAGTSLRRYPGDNGTSGAAAIALGDSLIPRSISGYSRYPCPRRAEAVLPMSPGTAGIPPLGCGRPSRAGSVHSTSVTVIRKRRPRRPCRPQAESVYGRGPPFPRLRPAMFCLPYLHVNHCANSLIMLARPAADTAAPQLKTW